MTESFSIFHDEASGEALTVVVCQDCTDGRMVKLMPVDPEWGKVHVRVHARCQAVSSFLRKLMELPPDLLKPIKSSYLEEIRLRAQVEHDADVLARAAAQRVVEQSRENFRERCSDG
ncbi:MAG: hypothetical protein K2Y32_00245 [Candidatus Obscuribacterales bacterium]|nr:hypothetical protein [Candidatus Obscuribacterales bacterium]